MRLRASRLLVFAAALLVAAPAEPAHPTGRQRPVEIVAVDLDGRRTSLTRDGAVAVAPAVARDGRVAFVGTRDGDGDLYVMDTDGGNVHRATTNSGVSASLDTLELSQAAWSPHGAMIAFDALYTAVAPNCAQHCANWRVVTVGSGGGDPTEIALPARAPAWSPDGRRLAYESGLDSYFMARSITISRADGSGAVHVNAINRDSSVGPVWSPRGGEIAFQASRTEAAATWICTVTPDGARVRRLAPGHNPTWSPDGRRLAFVHDYRLIVMKRNGTGMRQVSRKGEFVVAAAWSPAGPAIAYIAGTSRPRFGGLPQHLRLETVGAGGERVHVVLRGLSTSFVSGPPVWTPNGKRLLLALASQ